MYTIYFMLYLIEILHQTTTTSRSALGTFSLYLIEILHQTTTFIADDWPILSCILSKFYIKPQPYPAPLFRAHRCILSKFYIKPQQEQWSNSYQNVVSYRNSTSNHNPNFSIEFFDKLYLIEILHQTTTSRCTSTLRSCCILSKFYIKPQLGYHHSQFRSCCILSKFYIKPQQRANVMRNLRVVSYRNSTSNHN